VAERVLIPESSGEPSRWVVVSGDVDAPPGAFHLALAVRTEKPPAVRLLEVSGREWAAVLGIRVVPEEEQGR
jgi:hypothetical protein